LLMMIPYIKPRISFQWFHLIASNSRELYHVAIFVVFISEGQI
jgi:hypothetical protein